MPEPITRRRFLRDTAVVSGVAVLTDLGWSPRVDAGSGGAPGRNRHDRPSDGVFSQTDYGDERDEFLLRWTRWGGGSRLELRSNAILIDRPADAPEVIELRDFEQGRGHHIIAQHFGTPVLAQLRNEVAQLSLFA